MKLIYLMALMFTFFTKADATDQPNNSPGGMPSCFFEPWSPEDKQACPMALRLFPFQHDDSFIFLNMLYAPLVKAKIALESDNVQELLETQEGFFIHALKIVNLLDAMYPNESYPPHASEAIKAHKMNGLNLLEQIHQRLPEIHHQILTQLEHQFTEVKDYRQGPEHRTILTIGCGHGADECPTHSKWKMREQEILVSLLDADVISESRQSQQLGSYDNDIKGDAADPTFWKLFQNGTLTEINAYEMVPLEPFLSTVFLNECFQKLQASGVLYLAANPNYLDKGPFFLTDGDIINLIKRAGFQHVEKRKQYIKPSYTAVGEMRAWDVFIARK